MKPFLLLILLFVSPILFHPAIAAKEKSGKVTYKAVVNGKENPEFGHIELTYHDQIARIMRVRPDSIQLIPTVPDEATYIDFSTGKLISIATLHTGDRFHTSEKLSDLPTLEMTDDTQQILGYTCHKATTVVFSNRIDIWYTEDTGLRGSPNPPSGLPEGLVLKVVRNGNFELVADHIDFIKEKKMQPLLPEDLGKEVGDTQYQARITANYVTPVKVFDHEQINWGRKMDNPEAMQSGETYHFAGGTIILKKVKLPEVTDDYTVFAEITQYSNGDAYDRTGSVFLIPQEKKISFLDGLKKGVEVLPLYTDRQGKKYEGVVSTSDYEPPVELVRFFTPFGIQAYNERRKVAGITWEDSTQYKQDVTYLLPKLQGEAWIGAFIGNYDQGGHILSLTLKYHPGSNQVQEKKAQKYWVKPLFNTLNIMEMAGQPYATMFDGDSLHLAFEVPDGIRNLRLEYIATGHGGWGGGDEFNQKQHEIFVDGIKIFTYIPWRSDCGTFRTYNPASGNFWNGISSSDLSRSGWCPGTATNPITVLLPDLKAGTHHMQIAIPLGKPEGSSFSAWNISGVLVGEYK